MPLQRFDLVKGRAPEELKLLLDTAHDVVVKAFRVPLRDRYQIVHEHEPTHIIIEDTGLGINRSKHVVCLQVVSRARSRQQKEEFYRLLAQNLEHVCGLSSSDLFINFIENSDEDWSFGYGQAQFLIGSL